MSSHFDSVCTFNTLFGVYLPKSPQHNILTEDPKTVENALKLIREECREFHEAFVANDKVEQLDACIDICYVTLGMIARFGEAPCEEDKCMPFLLREQIMITYFDSCYNYDIEDAILCNDYILTLQWNCLICITVL